MVIILVILLFTYKELKSKPMDIAGEIANKIDDDIIDRVEVANPGFINIYLSKNYLLSNINTILDSGKIMVRVIMVMMKE